VLAVNISTAYPGRTFDTACILSAGEHAFIHHDSYVVYREAVIWQVPNVIARIQGGEIVSHEDMREPVFARVLSGFDISEQVLPKIHKFYRNFCI